MQLITINDSILFKYNIFYDLKMRKHKEILKSLFNRIFPESIKIVLYCDVLLSN